ncbi:MAG: hypothetical protein OEU50_22710, partial [Gammaproteobacteria bacterium]|nr:hypothetical protein [Gammaproteobacteria bacterium]
FGGRNSGDAIRGTVYLFRKAIAKFTSSEMSILSPNFRKAENPRIVTRLMPTGYAGDGDDLAGT